MTRLDAGPALEALGNTTALVVALVYGALLHLSVLAGLFGIVLGLLVSLSLCRFGYACLREVARGHRRLAPPGIESTNPFGDIGVVLHWVFFWLLAVLLATTPLLGDGFLADAARWCWLVGVAAFFPASAIVMAMTNNMVAALSPVSIGHVMRLLGRDYIRLLVMGASLMVFVVLVVGAFEHSWLLGFLADAVAAWGFLALFLMIGATLRAHRDDFDLVEGLDDLDTRADRARRDEWQKTLDRAYASVRSRLSAQGDRTITELLASEGDGLEIYQWVFNGMLAWDEPEHAARFGERFAVRLWESGRKIDALDLARQCRKLSADFALPADCAAELAAYARSIGRHRAADEIAGAGATRATASTPR